MSDANSTISRRTYRFWPNPAIFAPRTTESEVKLTPYGNDQSHTRHVRQLVDNRIRDLNKLPGRMIDATKYCACYEVDAQAQNLKAMNGELVFRQHLYLFSILVAFEWQPSPNTLQRVQVAAQKASNLLYDVTDGFMAIGQVIIGGPDLLDVADIQVMASNRFHPRSWISALHEDHKYQPIRVGRGLWRKDQGFVVPWDESEAYRVLVHEWGHYALGLVDEYLDLVQLTRSNTSQRQWKGEVVAPSATPSKLDDRQHLTSLYIVAPSIALPIDSIMSTLASSELIPRSTPEGAKQRVYMQRKIQGRFPKVALDTPLEGPTELPLPDLPVFARSTTITEAGEELSLSPEAMARLEQCIKDDSQVTNPVILGSSWVYVLKVDERAEPTRIIGQGVLTDRDLKQGFELLGATIRDEVVVVALIAGVDSSDPNAAKLSYTRVIRGQFRQDANEQLNVAWDDVSPAMPPDFIDVLPVDKRSIIPDTAQLPVKLRVQIEVHTLPSKVSICALGQALIPFAEDPQRSSATTIAYPDGPARMRWVSAPVELNHLDGHVLLEWADGTKYICGYSHGGGPCTGGGGRCVCYTAGSYEGNSMLFYRDNLDPSDAQSIRLTEALQEDDLGTRIVSTVMHGGAQYIQHGGSRLAEARSYIFSLGSNQPLTARAATLVLYYDADAREHDGDLLIYRWNEGAGWKRVTTYAPPNQSYVCIPLDAATPETSSPTNGRIGEYFDRYRIYWTPD